MEGKLGWAVSDDVVCSINYVSLMFSDVSLQRVVRDNRVQRSATHPELGAGLPHASDRPTDQGASEDGRMKVEGGGTKTPSASVTNRTQKK